MKWRDILQYIDSIGITHNVFIQHEIGMDSDFVPASLRKVIPNGIYYIQNITAYTGDIPSQSVIFTNAFIQSSSHLIVVDNPQLAHYKLMQAFRREPAKTIHPTALISADATIGKNVSIGPYCVVGNSILEDNVCLNSHVVIEDNVVVGANTFIDSHSVIGASGLAWIWDDNGNRIMQPQLGGVMIGPDCLLATDITVVRGSLSDNTCIGQGSVISHGTKIGHGCDIGAHVHMANNVSLAGNATIGRASFLGSACVISSNVIVPPNTIVGAAALVTKNFDEEYLTLAGVPASIIKRNNFTEKPKGVPKPLKK